MAKGSAMPQITRRYMDYRNMYQAKAVRARSQNDVDELQWSGASSLPSSPNCAVIGMMITRLLMITLLLRSPPSLTPAICTIFSSLDCTLASLAVALKFVSSSTSPRRISLGSGSRR